MTITNYVETAVTNVHTAYSPEVAMQIMDKTFTYFGIFTSIFLGAFSIFLGAFAVIAGTNYLRNKDYTNIKTGLGTLKTSLLTTQEQLNEKTTLADESAKNLEQSTSMLHEQTFHLAHAVMITFRRANDYPNTIIAGIDSLAAETFCAGFTTSTTDIFNSIQESIRHLIEDEAIVLVELYRENNKALDRINSHCSNDVSSRLNELLSQIKTIANTPDEEGANEKPIDEP